MLETGKTPLKMFQMRPRRAILEVGTSSGGTATGTPSILTRRTHGHRHHGLWERASSHLDQEELAMAIRIRLSLLALGDSFFEPLVWGQEVL